MCKPFPCRNLSGGLLEVIDHGIFWRNSNDGPCGTRYLIAEISRADWAISQYHQEVSAAGIVEAQFPDADGDQVSLIRLWKNCRLLC